MALTSIAFASLFAFSRASVGTFVGSDGYIQTAAANAPRFGHDPITLAARGLLVEASRSNQFLHSSNFTQNAWAKIGSQAAAVAALAPDNTNTAQKLVEDTSTGQHAFAQAHAATLGANSVVAVSVFAKAAERSLLSIFGLGTAFTAGTGGSGDQQQVVFNVATGVITFTNSGITGAYIEPYRDGWYRCVAVFTTSNASGTATFRLRMALTGTDVAYAGVDGSGLLLWGAQSEGTNSSGVYSSLIQTTTATVTRSADSCEITGANFANFFNRSEGTLFARIQPNLSGFRSGFTFVSIGNAAYSSPNRAAITAGATNTPRLLVDASGDVTDDVARTAGAPFNVAISYRDRLFMLAVDGQVRAIDTNKLVGLAAAIEMAIGATTAQGSHCNAHIQRVFFVPRSLSTHELEAATR